MFGCCQEVSSIEYLPPLSFWWWGGHYADSIFRQIRRISKISKTFCIYLSTFSPYLIYLSLCPPSGEENTVLIPSPDRLGVLIQETNMRFSPQNWVSFTVKYVFLCVSSWWGTDTYESERRLKLHINNEIFLHQSAASLSSSLVSPL